MNLLDLTLNERLFALFIGRSGSGKSAAASSFAHPYHELDFDLRAGGILDWAKKGKVDGNTITVQQFKPQGGWAPVDKHLEELRAKITAGTFNIKTIGLGSVTNMTRLFNITSVRLKGGMPNRNQINIDGFALTDGSDYKFEAQATHAVFDYLRVFPCNVIATAHIAEKWGKRPSAGRFDPAEILGEKLTITAQLGENIQTYFDNVFRFSKEIIKNKVTYFVEFATDIAKNSYGLPPGRFDITDKNFAEEFERLNDLNAKGELKPPKEEGFSMI